MASAPGQVAVSPGQTAFDDDRRVGQLGGEGADQRVECGLADAVGGGGAAADR
jgi:hypothetical protein